MACSDALSLADATRRLSSFRDVTSEGYSEDYSDAFTKFSRASRLATREAPANIPAELIVACLMSIAQFVGIKKVRRSQVYECVSLLRQLPEWAPLLDFDGVKLVLEKAGFHGGWESLLVAPGEPKLGKEKTAGTAKADLDEAPPGDDCRPIEGAGDNDHELIQCENAKDARKRALYDTFKNLCRIVLKVEAGNEHEQELMDLRDNMFKWWKNHSENSRLHYVFGGLVSSGKTTLINSVLVNALENFPQDVELLESDILENTSAVTVLDINPAWQTIHVQREEYGYDASGNAVQAPVIDNVSTHASIEELKEQLPIITGQLQTKPDTVNRLVIKLPFKFVPVPSRSRQLNEFFWEQPCGEYGNPRLSPIIVDTPGLDSLLVKHQLLSILQNRTCVFCFLVDFMKPNPFGNQGFHVLKFLMERLHIPVPPVIVFTKWEAFVNQWRDRRFVKLQAKGQSPDQVATRYLQEMFKKLEQANIKSKPYFAAVDALSAVCSVESLESCMLQSDEDKFTQRAKIELSSFMQKLHNLGSQLAAPLQHHRAVCKLAEETQRVINIVFRDNEEARILNQRAMMQMRDVATEIKTRFKRNVQKYFANVQWTKEGVESFVPEPPFSRDSCAISSITSAVTAALEEYQASSPKAISLHDAILEVVNNALHQIQNNILRDIHTLEEEAMQDFARELWERIGDRKKLLSESAVTNAHFFIGGLVLGVAGGVAAGGAVLGVAATATSGFFVGAGWMTAVSMGVGAGAIPIVIGLAWWRSPQIGWWTWEDCGNGALTEVLEALKKRQGELIESVVEAFNAQVDATMEKVDEFRIPDGSSEDARQAEKVFDNAFKEKREAEKQVNDVLASGSMKNRWLVGDSHLQWLVDKVAKDTCLL